MADLLDRYLADRTTQTNRHGRRVSPATIRAARADLHGFMQWWEQAHQLTFDVGLVLEQDPGDWQEHRQIVEGAKPATINRASASLRAFFTWAATTQLISHTPAAALHDLVVEDAAPRGVPPEGVAWLVRAASAQPDPMARHRDLAMLTLLSDCGVRSQEAVESQLRDLDLDGAQLIVRSGKGRTPRRVPLTTTALRRLRDYLTVRCPTGPEAVGSETEREPLLIGRHITKAGQPWEPGLTTAAIRKRIAALGTTAAHRIAEQAAKESQVTRVTELHELAGTLRVMSPHQLRHGLAYRLLKNGATPTYVQKILGHSRVSTSLMYGKPTEADVREAMERADRVTRRVEP